MPAMLGKRLGNAINLDALAFRPEEWSFPTSVDLSRRASNTSQWQQAESSTTLRGIPEPQCPLNARFLSQCRRNAVGRATAEGTNRIDSLLHVRRDRNPTKIYLPTLPPSPLDPTKRITALCYIVLSGTYGVSPDFSWARR